MLLVCRIRPYEKPLLDDGMLHDDDELVCYTVALFIYLLTLEVILPPVTVNMI